jgi:hypothetical protein
MPNFVENYFKPKLFTHETFTQNYGIVHRIIIGDV